MTKEEIKDAYSIEDVLRRHGATIYPGHRCRPICHDAAARSKNAVYDRTRYTCFVCNIHHDVISLEMELSHCDFQTACRLISGEDLTPEQRIDRSHRQAEQLARRAEKERKDEEHRKLVERLCELNKIIDATKGFGEDWNGAEEYKDALNERDSIWWRLEHGG